MYDIHGVLGPKQQKKKLKKQNQQPSRFLGKIDEFGNLDAVLIQTDKNNEKKVPESQNFGDSTSEPGSGFWF